GALPDQLLEGGSVAGLGRGHQVTTDHPASCETPLPAGRLRGSRKFSGSARAGSRPAPSGSGMRARRQASSTSARLFLIGYSLTPTRSTRTHTSSLARLVPASTSVMVPPASMV